MYFPTRDEEINALTNKICNTSPIIITEYWANGQFNYKVEPNPNYKPLR